MSRPGLLGQEALFNAISSDRSTAQTRSILENVPYTFRLRELRVVVSPVVSLDWNDNVLLAKQKESDLVLSPRLDVHAMHPIGTGNLLSLDVGIGYTKYLEHEDLDRLLITPNSMLSLNMAVGDVRINVHDRLTYQLDPVLVGAVSGTGSFGGIDNSAGTSLTWELHKVRLSLGYDFLKWIAADSRNSYLDRSTHQTLARVGVEVHPSASVGLEATASPTIYDESYLNDNVGYSFGGFADWQLTEQLHLAPRGGFSLYTFSPSPILGDQADYGAYYFGLQLDHRPNEKLSYRLSADRQIRPGVEANLTDIFNTTLSVSWLFIRMLPLSASVYYEHGKQTGGGLSEQWDRYGGSVGLTYQVTDNLSSSLSYGLTFRDSKLADRDYLQNRVTLTLAYRL